MDDSRESNRTKMIEENDLSKTDKLFGRHDFEAILFVVGIVLLLAYLMFFGTVNDAIGNFIGKTFWSIRPYSVAHFSKLPRVDNQETICRIAGGSSHVTNTFFTYDKSQIFIYDSLSMTNLVNTIRIPGEITKIHCYFNNLSGLKEYMSKDSEIINPYSGMFIYCEYKVDKLNHLMCMNISRSSYDRYDNLKFYKDRYGPDEENVKKHYFDFGKVPGFDANDEVVKSVLERRRDIYNNWIHPAKAIRKLYDVDIGKANYLSISFDNSTDTTTTVIIDKLSSFASLLNSTGKTISKLNFAKIVWCHTIPGEEAYCMLFDGTSLTSFNVENEKLRIMKTTKLGVSTEKENIKLFINDEPSNCVYMSDYILSNNDALEKINFTDLSSTKINSNIDSVVYGTNYYTDKYGKTTFFNLIEEKQLLKQCKMLYIEGNWLRSRQIDAYRYPTLDSFIALTTDQQNICQIYFIAIPYMFSLSTRGIDEPVDEAHVTYEDDKLTIYFMNKNSIYRWQNSQPGIDNLKLRQLDLKPEPIKTKNSQ